MFPYVNFVTYIFESIVVKAKFQAGQFLSSMLKTATIAIAYFLFNRINSLINIKINIIANIINIFVNSIGNINDQNIDSCHRLNKNTDKRQDYNQVETNRLGSA